MAPTITAASGQQPRPGLWHFRKSLTAGFVFSAVINALMLSLPLYSLQVFSRAIPSGNTDTLFMLTLIVALALTVMTVLEVVRTRIFNRAGTYLEIAFRPYLMEAAIDAGTRGRQDWSSIADLMEVRGFLNRPTLSALCDLPWMPVYAIGIYQIHPLLCGLMAAGSAALVGLAMLGHVVTRTDSDDAKAGASRAARMADALGLRGDTVRALRMQAATVQQWAMDNAAGTAASGAALERGGTLQAIAKWVRLLLQVGVTGVGAMLVMDNQLSFGGMIATSLLLGRAMAPVEQISAAWGPTGKALSAWKRLSPVLKRISRQPQPGTLPAGAGNMRIESVMHLSLLDQRPILRSITFSLSAGEMLCVFGPNRAGKSTLARLLTGTAKPHSGMISLDGVEVSGWRPNDPRWSIGYVPQHAEWLPGTIGQNIARFLPDEGNGGAIDAAQRAGIHETIAALPQGYDTDIAAIPALLTGGTERLIALARALFGRPSLLVLDEPASYVDMPGQEAIRRALKRAKEDRITTIVLGQQSTFLDLADQVMVLNGGTIQAFGPRDKVIQQRKPTPAPETKAVEAQ